MNEKSYLRELANRYSELANLPVMRERAALWLRHNRLKGDRPMLVMEMTSFEDDLLPPLQCESEFGRRMEKELISHIVNFEQIGDDKVIPGYLTVPMDVQIKLFNLDPKRTYAKDATGRELGFREEHFIKDLEEDLPKLQNSKVIIDLAATGRYVDFAEDILDGLMPVKVKNESLRWIFGISNRIIELMGMEAFMYAIYDYPEQVKQLYEFICDDMVRIIRTMEEEDLLTPNNGNDYAGAGSFGFSDELRPEGKIRSNMLWGNMNSQETVGISADAFEEFAFPAYERLAKEFGLVYYGCCEPVHPIWESCISRLHHLRKVSVSPWCNEEYMGDVLKDSNVIYSRKPNPNLIGVGYAFDEEVYGNHIAHTLRMAKGCKLEIIHRDIYTLSGNTCKAKRAVEIARREIERNWQP